MEDYKITVSNEYVVNKYKTLDKVAADVLAKLHYEVLTQAVNDPKSAEVKTILLECYKKLLKKEN